MNNLPLISIIIPMYNAENSIEQCVSSVIAQSYKNIEILLIDDGSTDNTFQKCKAFNDKRIHVFQKENGGVSSARNYGLTMAKGELISFVDADDIVLHNYVSYLYYLIESCNADISICNFKRISKENAISFQNSNDEKNDIVLYNSEEARLDLLYKKNITGYCYAKLFRRSAIENVSFDTYLKVAEDFLFAYSAFENASRIVYGNSILYLYINNPNSCMHDPNHLKYQRTWDYLKNKITTDEVSNPLIMQAQKTYLFIGGVSFYSHSSNWADSSKDFKNDIVKECSKLSKGALFDRNSKLVYRIIAFLVLLAPKATCELLKSLVTALDKYGFVLSRPV